MKVKKGEYRINKDSGWVTEEGSYILCFPFLIHRSNCSTRKNSWSLSHQATGYAIKRDILLKQAKALAESLKEYALFLVPTVETFTLQKEILMKKDPQKYNNLIKAIDTNGESHEQ